MADNLSIINGTTIHVSSGAKIKAQMLSVRHPDVELVSLRGWPVSASILIDRPMLADLAAAVMGRLAEIDAPRAQEIASGLLDFEADSPAPDHARSV